MSTLDKLQIKGVRSFGTQANDEQTITFFSPLTLILGENGCGKTTIIECIKYALTGELPPGSSKGQSFVHDPKIFSTSHNSMGQVKLRLLTAKGDKVTVCRSMRTSIPTRGNTSNLKFETLDSTIDIERNGERRTISKRCVDVNAEMANVMQVSKSIINNVLFCHQEDSNWPLEESKKLKERFDTIFGTSEYNKAIEKIIKLRKKYDAEAKQKANDLKLLKHFKNEADTKNCELQKAETKMNSLQQTFDSLEKELQPIIDRIDKIRCIELEISKLYTKKTEVSTKLKNCQDQQLSLSNKIKNKFDGTIVQLDRELRTFQDVQKEKKTSLSDYELSLSDLKMQEKRIQTQLTESDRKITDLIRQRSEEQETSSKLAQKLKDMCISLGNITVPVDLENTFDPIVVDTKLGEINAALGRENALLSQMSKQHDQIDHQHQIAVDKLRECRTAAETEMKTKQKLRTELSAEQSKIKSKIEAIEKSAVALQRITKNLADTTAMYEGLIAKGNFTEKKQQIDLEKSRQSDFEVQLESMDKDIAFLSSIAKTVAEISIKETQLITRNEEIRKIRNKHADNFSRLFNDQAIECNYQRRVQTVYQNMQREINDLNKRAQNIQQTVTKLKMTRTNQKEELARSEKELADGEENVYKHCHSMKYEDAVERVKITLSKHQLDHGALKASDVLYKKYIQKMEGLPCCPLCHKDMSTNEVTELSTELTDEIRRLPDNIKRVELVLRDEQKKLENLLSLQPVTVRLAKLQIDIPLMKSNLKRTEEELSEALAESESSEVLVAEPMSNMELANNILGDMSVLDEAQKDGVRLENELKKLRANLPTSTVNTNLDEAQLKRNQISDELKQSRNLAANLEKTYEEETRIVNNVRDKRSQLQDQKIHLQENVQALSQFKARVTDIENQITLITAELTELGTKLEPLKIEMEQVMLAKKKDMDKNRDELHRARTKYNDLLQRTEEMKRWNSELKRLSELNLVAHIDRLKNSIRQLNEDHEIKIAENVKITEIIDNLRKEIHGQEGKYRDLCDNRELLELIVEEKQLQLQCDELCKDMNDQDFNSVSRERDSLIKRQDGITSKRSECTGQINELRNQVARHKSELAQPQYRDAIKNCRELNYDYVVTQKCGSDLAKYRMALEWALMQYHSEKMESINREIKRLWHTIYRGNDIDYIKIICTDETKSQSIDKKRNYEYRVVQIKNNSELDMRGRCSAGQRVLACLIIRIVLAETFSMNCGVLALDEPTTNLDKANILSLCEALKELVAERAATRSFMLIIITHDTNFINMLGSSGDHWKITRGNDGKSLIRLGKPE